MDSKTNLNSVYLPLKGLIWKYSQQLSFIRISCHCCVHHLLLPVYHPPSLSHDVYFPGHWLVIGVVWQEVTASVVVQLCLLWCGEACSLVIYIKALGGNRRPGTWSSLMAQSVLGDDQCGEMIRGGRGPTLEQKWLLRNNYYFMKRGESFFQPSPFLICGTKPNSETGLLHIFVF